MKSLCIADRCMDAMGAAQTSVLSVEPARPLLVSALSSIDLRSDPLVFRIPASVNRDDGTQVTSTSTSPNHTKRRESTACSVLLDLLPNNDESLLGTKSSAANVDADEKKSKTSSTGSKKRWFALQKVQRNIAISCCCEYEQVNANDEKHALENETTRLQALKKLMQEPPASRMAALIAQQRENERLRQALRDQQLILARAQSSLTGYSIAQGASFEKYIHLGVDRNDRKATFAELKHRILYDAERYINNRLQSLDPTAAYSQVEKFTAPNRDVCFSCFDVIPLPSEFTSIKQVFEAVRLFFFNTEIKYTEESDELMLREGEYNESDDQDVVTQRFVRSTSSGTQIESNSVLFSELREAAGGEEGDSAIFSVDFVNQDDLYPYRPTTRLRQDTTCVVMLRAYPSTNTKSKRRQGSSASMSSSPSPRSPVTKIVLTRAYSVRLRQSDELVIPLDAIDGMNFASSFCSKVLLKAVGEIVASSHVQLRA